MESAQTGETSRPVSADTPRIVSAALLVRDDGRVLVVRHRESDGEFGGLWSLPMHPVRDEEVAEDALARVLRDRLHVEPGPSEFAETLFLSGAGGGRYIVNVFTCVEWRGEPRFSEREYQDAAWITPGAPGALALVPELRNWLAGAFEGEAVAADAPSLTSLLDGARSDLMAAYEAISDVFRDRPLDGGWSPLDVLAHVASAEAYYVAESRRLTEIPGHTWRGFNASQWEEGHRLRAPAAEADVRALLTRARARTLDWLPQLSEQQIAAYGNHPERGAVTVGDRIEKIARHDREHAEQLRAMQHAVRVAGGVGGEAGER